MSYRDQRFIGVVNADSIVQQNFIIGSGNFASGSNLIADVNISTGDETLIRPGQVIFSVAGAVPAGTAVQSVNEDYTQITLNQQATSTAASDTFGLSTPSGSYLFQSASFNDPNNNLSVNNISGSDSGSSFAIVGVAKKNNATVKNRFHLYTVSEVVYRNIGSSEISFFVEWGEQGVESDSGDILQTAEREVAIIDLTDTGSIAPGFSLGVAGMESVKAGSEYAGYNIAITQYLSDLSGSAAGGTTATGSFTGSFTGSNYSTEFTFSGDTLNVIGDVYVQGTLDAATKNFKIQHPTMEGYYLVHSSLEGPERGIYHRGKLSVSNIIHLPDYWKDLPVDETDMTVQLTPIGNACHHWVKRVTKETIEIECECGKPNCYYIIHAQRYNEGKFEILEPKIRKKL
jgi:hypothetical protein